MVMKIDSDLRNADWTKWRTTDGAETEHLPAHLPVMQWAALRAMEPRSYRAKLDDGFDLCQRIDLPDISDVSFPSLIGGPMSTMKPKRKARPSVQWKGVSLARVPTRFEQFALSLSDVPDRMGAEKAAMVQTLDACRKGQLARMDMATIEGDDDEAVSLVQDFQARMATFGASEVAREVARQRRRPAPDEQDFASMGEDARHDLRHSAALMTDRLQHGWRNDLKRLAGRVHGAKRKADMKTRRAAWFAKADSRTADGLKTAVNQLGNEAYSAGRKLQLKSFRRGPKDESYRARLIALAGNDDSTLADDVDYFVYSAIHDKNACDPCLANDGKILSEDELDDYEPPFVDCEGGDNCRCQIVAVVGNWRDKGDVADALDSDRYTVATEKQADAFISKREDR
jgi:hypothetical protein